MSDVLTVEEAVTALNERAKYQDSHLAMESSGPFYRQLVATIEAQAAEIDKLKKVIEKINFHSSVVESDNSYESVFNALKRCWSIVTDTLSEEILMTAEEFEKEELLAGIEIGRRKIESQAVEIKGLREALEGVRPFAEACKNHEFNGKYPGKAVYGFNGVNLTFDALNQVLDALSRTPAEWVEGERVEGDVLRAATEWQTYWHENPHDEEGINRRQGYLYDRVKRLKAWEGGK